MIVSNERKVIKVSTITKSSNQISFFQRLQRFIIRPFMNEEEKLELRYSSRKLKIFSRNNFLVIGLFLLWDIGFFFIQFVEDPNNPRLVSFDPSLTVKLQAYSTPLLDAIASYLYMVGFMGVLTVLFLTFFGEEEHAWKYLLAFHAWFVIATFVQFLYPVIVQIRIDPIPSGIPHIRAEVAPWSEALIGIKYAGIPSGHAAGAILLWMTGRERKVDWVRRLGLVTMVLIPVITLYTGDHYIWDVVVSYILCPVIFLGTLRLIKRWEAKKELTQTTTS